MPIGSTILVERGIYMAISAIRFFSNLNSQKASLNQARSRSNASLSFKGNDQKEIRPGEPGYGTGKGHFETRAWENAYPDDWDGPTSGAGYDPVWVPDRSSNSSYGGYYAGSGD